MKIVELNKFELGIYYVFIFLLLNEWLKPILILTKTGYYQLILLFIAISIFLKWLQAPLIISWMTRIIYICWFIVYVYENTFFLTAEGLAFLSREITENLSYIVTLNLGQITNPFRTVLLFILIWMLIYLIHHWLVNKLNLFTFLLMTVLFITVLDTFTDFDGSSAIVKIIIIGLIMSAFLYLKRLFIEEKVIIEYKKYLKMLYPTVLIISCVGIVAIFLPKAAPQWSDPVPFIKSVTNSNDLLGENKEISKIGYDEDDSQLGGPFVGDDTVIFKVIDSKKQYWRIETKDIYTSKGWQSSKWFEGNIFYESGELMTSFLPIGTEEDIKRATIINEALNDFVIYPYGIRTIELERRPRRFRNLIKLDENIEKFQFIRNENQYIVEYSSPVFKFSELTKQEEYDGNFDMYLQLPDTLPRRVVDLANEIVEGQKSNYEKARAIETYFRQNGFRYDTEDVAIPKEDEDYVDQFLFETKVGYCDNFSTSMVVLLRSVGIPARWVKGFVTGDLIERIDEQNIYEITNNEAHSWVEAYFPTVGWVNFEPTIGFANDRSIEFDIEQDSLDEDMFEQEEETKPEEKISSKDDKEEEEKTKSKNVVENIFSKNIWVFFVLCLLILTVLLVFFTREKWTWKFALRSIRNKPMNADNFEQHYLLLLKVLEGKGLGRKNGQTLSSFAQDVDEIYQTNKMSELTSNYEKFIYSQHNENIDFAKMKEIWQFLVNFEVG